MDQIIALLREGQKIAAIKLYREKTGLGLREAKDAVEAISTQHKFFAPAKGGCLGLAGAFLLLLAGVARMIFALLP